MTSEEKLMQDILIVVKSYNEQDKPQTQKDADFYKNTLMGLIENIISHTEDARERLEAHKTEEYKDVYPIVFLQTESECVTWENFYEEQLQYVEENIAEYENGKTGDSNSGNMNSGYRNSGHRNSGASNSGNSNSGYRNSGDSNSGNSNSGNWNSGARNSGGMNSGSWNSCDRQTGYFNSKDSDEIRVFNCLCKVSEWENAKKPKFIYNIELMYWDDEEGCLKERSYEEAWKIAFDAATEEDIQLLKSLPNFDAQIFQDITGIHIGDKQ
jgi:hypothetical protein